MPVARQTEPVPFVSTAQMIEVDRAMIEDYGIDLMQMMENAGRNLAHLTRLRFLDGDPVGRRVIVLAGTGGNAGGAMVAARRLHNWGAAVQVVLGQPASRLVEVARRQFEILQRMGGRRRRRARPSTARARPTSSSTASSATACAEPRAAAPRR